MNTETQQNSRSTKLESMYHDASRDFRKIWSQYSKNKVELLSALEAMIDILFEENPNTSIHKILSKIGEDHCDLQNQGFSKPNLYKYVQISKYGYKLRKNNFSSEKSKFPENITGQSSGTNQQVEEEARKLSELYDINLEEESPMLINGFTSLSRKIERLTGERNNAITQRDHYKKYANDQKIRIIRLLRSHCERLVEVSKEKPGAYLVVDFDTHDEFPSIADISDHCPTPEEVKKITGGDAAVCIGHEFE